MLKREQHEVVGVEAVLGGIKERVETKRVREKLQAPRLPLWSQREHLKLHPKLNREQPQTEHRQLRRNKAQTSEVGAGARDLEVVVAVEEEVGGKGLLEAFQRPQSRSQ